MPAVKGRKQSDLNSLLAETYFNAQHPASFGGISKLSKATNINPKAVKQFLSQQWTYNLHKPIRNVIPRRKYISRGLNHQWQSDLVEMQQYSRENQGNRYIICVIDIFSRFAYARPLKTKTGSDVSEALKSIFQDGSNLPKYLQTDQGKEFYNYHVKSLLESYNIELFSVYSEKKAAIVERFQRTLQERMYRAFTYQGNYKWLDLLPKLIDSYNNSYHRSIKTTPALVNKSNETDIWINQYSNIKVQPKQKFNVGDYVRIPKEKTVFSKGYIEKWTDEEFVITHVKKKFSPAMYTIADLNGETIKGSFYEQELQKVVNPQKLYRIERVIRTRTINNVKQALVKWKGYKNPSWIDYSQIQSI